MSDMNRGLFVLDVAEAVGCQAAAQCDDGNPCTTDTCDKDGQCVHTIVESGASCDDGNVCTINGQCDADGNCVVTDINTIPCDDDGPCAPGACDMDAGLCVCFPCLRADSPFEETPVTTAKNRYVSFTPANPGESTALRVTLSNLPAPFNAFDGTEMWVGEPRVYCENSGQDIPPAEGCGPAGGLPSLTFLAAPLQCTPLFRDWGSDGPLHVFGDAIVPDARYQIQAINQGCYDADVPNFSAALGVTQSKWGDVCGSGPGGGACRGVADGRVEVIQDVLGLIDKFVNINSLQKASADLDPGTPDQKVTIIGDALFALDAFQGASFPFAGPTPCP